MSTNFSPCGNFEPYVPVQITQIVILSMIFVLSLVGNTLIIIVVYKRPELRKTMNYFIVNMAVSDFVFPLTSIPASLGETSVIPWKWPIRGTTGLLLYNIKSFLMSVSLTVSIESLVWIAFDRFVAVVWPLKAHLVSSRFRAFAIIFTWIVALVFSSLDLHFSKPVLENGTITSHADTTSSTLETYIYTRVAVVYIVPMMLITISYSAIAVTLRRRHKVLQCNTAQRTDLKNRRAIKMSLCIVALFYLFSLPFAVAIMFSYTPFSCSFFNHFLLFSTTAVYISSTTNPIICFTFVESFRRGLRELLNFFLCKPVKTRTTERGRDEIILKRIKVTQSIIGENITKPD